MEADYILPPGVTLPAHLIPCKPPSKLLDRDDFLHSQLRKCHHVLGDGNCLFRAVSHQLYGTEEKHLEIRMSLIDFINQNKSKYEQFWIDSNSTFSEHMDSIKNPGSWGTELELKACSDYLSIPVFVCTPDLKSNAYRWEKFNPFSWASGSSQLDLLPFTEGHIELAHNSTRDHYDSIVPYDNHSLLSLPTFRTKTVASLTV